MIPFAPSFLKPFGKGGHGDEPALIPAPIHYWDLDGVWVDEVGAFDLTAIGPVIVLPTGGPDGGPCADFGTNARLEGGTRSWDGAAGDIISVSSWVWFDVRNTGGAGSWWFNWRAATPADTRIFQCHDSITNNGLGFGVADDNELLVAAYSSGPPSLGTWYHVVGVNNGSTIKIYVNGELETTVDSSALTDFDTGSAPLAIGAAAWAPVSTALRFDGRVAMAGIWDKELTQADVEFLFNSGDGRRFADLINNL